MNEEEKKVACVKTILCECGFCMSLKRISQEVPLQHTYIVSALFFSSFGSTEENEHVSEKESEWKFICFIFR